MPKLSDILNPVVNIESALVNAVKAPLGAMGVALPEPPFPPPATLVARQIGGQTLPDIPIPTQLPKLPGMPSGEMRLPNFPGVRGGQPLVTPPEIRVGVGTKQQPPPGVGRYVIGWPS